MLFALLNASKSISPGTTIGAPCALAVFGALDFGCEPSLSPIALGGGFGAIFSGCRGGIILLPGRFAALFSLASGRVFSSFCVLDSAGSSVSNCAFSPTCSSRDNFLGTLTVSGCSKRSTGCRFSLGLITAYLPFCCDSLPYWGGVSSKGRKKLSRACSRAATA